MDLEAVAREFEKNGYAVIPDFLTQEEVEGLRGRALALADSLPESEWEQRCVLRGGGAES